MNTQPFLRPEMLLFDVGNVLICDDTSAIFVYRCLYETLGGKLWGSAHDLVKRRSELLESGTCRDLWQVVDALLPEQYNSVEFRNETRRKLYAEWGRYSPPIPQMGEVVKELSRHYRLGLLANQPETVEDVLRERHLWDFFEVKGVSNIVGMQKPERAFFQWAVDQAGLPPEKIMMVGDRLDNDVRPAKEFGMTTCWIDFARELRPWQPEDDFDAVMKRCKHLVCIPPVVDPSDPLYKPDMRVTSPADMLRQFTQLK